MSALANVLVTAMVLFPRSALGNAARAETVEGIGGTTMMFTQTAESGDREHESEDLVSSSDCARTKAVAGAAPVGRAIPDALNEKEGVAVAAIASTRTKLEGP